MGIPGVISFRRFRIALAVGTVGLAAAGVAWFSLRSPAPAVPAPVAVQAPAAPAKPASKTVRFSDSQHHPWPPKPEVAGPPAGSGVPVTMPPRDLAARPKTPPPPQPEPPAPSAAALKEESLRTGDQITAEEAREVLLDDKKSSALKLAVIDKLRGQDPEEVISVLVAFLEHRSTPAAAYTKPTAVKVLSDLRDPRADEALQKLARSSPDERVRLTIAALQAKEKTR